MRRSNEATDTVTITVEDQNAPTANAGDRPYCRDLERYGLTAAHQVTVKGVT